jgi:hypothetical protein
MFIRGKTYITAAICDFNFRYKHEGVMLNYSVDWNAQDISTTRKQGLCIKE